MAHDAKHARAIRRIANTSGLVAPLIARGRTLGTISLGTIEGQPRFDESDLAMAMELARRISLALDNARLFSEAQERAHAAEALEYVDDGVILVDEAGIVRLWNPTAAISLRRPAVEAVGRPIAELLGDWQSLQSRIPVASEPQAGEARARRRCRWRCRARSGGSRSPPSASPAAPSTRSATSPTSAPSSR